MNTIANFVFAPVAVATSLALLAPAVSAADPEAIVVSPADMNMFRDRVTRSLDRSLENGERVYGKVPQSGIVQIRFQLDDSGKPAGLEMVGNTSGNTGAHVANWAVRRLRDLDQAPVANARSAVFQANIVFAHDSEEKARLSAQLHRADKARMALGGDNAQVVMIGV